MKSNETRHIIKVMLVNHNLCCVDHNEQRKNSYILLMWTRCRRLFITLVKRNARRLSRSFARETVAGKSVDGWEASLKINNSTRPVSSSGAPQNGATINNSLQCFVSALRLYRFTCVEQATSSKVKPRQKKSVWSKGAFRGPLHISAIIQRIFFAKHVRRRCFQWPWESRSLCRIIEIATFAVVVTGAVVIDLCYQMIFAYRWKCMNDSLRTFPQRVLNI